MSIDFGDPSEPVASFRFGDDGSGRAFTLEVALGTGPNLEQAIAGAAQDAATDLRAWAQEAEDFAARASAGALRQTSSTP